MADFGITSTAPGVVPFGAGVTVGSITTYTAGPFDTVAGTWSLVEKDLPDYAEGAWSCTNQNGGAYNAGSVTLGLADNVTCTITNLFAKLAVVKSASPAFYSKAGDVITYTVTTTNVGAATLTNVGVSDPLIPQLSSWTCTVDGAAVTLPVASLAPGKSIVCKATYTITQADVDNVNKSIPNTACAISAQTSKPVCDDERVYESELAIVKTSNVQLYDAVGDVITYTVKATEHRQLPAQQRGRDRQAAGHQARQLHLQPCGARGVAGARCQHHLHRHPYHHAGRLRRWLGAQHRLRRLRPDP